MQSQLFDLRAGQSAAVKTKIIERAAIGLAEPWVADRERRVGANRTGEMIFQSLDLGFFPVQIKLNARSPAGAIVVDGHVMPFAKNECLARAHLPGVIGPVM